jgi:hypothetical protein
MQRLAVIDYPVGMISDVLCKKFNNRACCHFEQRLEETETT